MNKYFIILIVTLLFLVAYVENTQEATAGKKELSVFNSEWYSKHLKKMGERPLAAYASGNISVYRFTILPTWGNPVSVRLTINGTKAQIEARRLDGQGGYDPGKLIEENTATLNSKEIEEFKKLFEKLNFYKMETNEKCLGCDGSEWLLEALQNGNYHYIDRWTPTYDAEKRNAVDFINLCTWLYRKAPIKSDLTNKGDIEIKK